MAKHAAPSKGIMGSTSRTRIVTNWTQEPSPMETTRLTESARHIIRTVKASYELADNVTKEFIAYSIALFGCAVMLALIDVNVIRAVIEIIMAVIVGIMVKRIAFAPETNEHNWQYRGHHIQNEHG